MKIVSLFILSFLCYGTAQAEELHLKNGKTINGSIIERNNKSVKISADGMTMTYFADEIADIDGTPMGSPAPAAVATAPVESPVAEVTAAPVVENVVKAPQASAPSATSGSKKELILKFIDVFGTRTAMTQNLAAMVKSLPADNPQTAKIKNGINVDEIIERLIPVYDKQFGEADLKAFIEFYSSPAGRKLVEGIPEIMRESIDVSGQYFQEKFPEMNEENKK